MSPWFYLYARMIKKGGWPLVVGVATFIVLASVLILLGAV